MASTNISMLKKTGNNIHSDECYTPKEAILPLLEFLQKNKLYYDCTSEKSSSIVDCMRLEGYSILSSGSSNFLTDSISDNIDVILTNPPYSKKDKFIKHCYEIGKPFALLLPVSSLQGQMRGKLFDRNGVEALVLNKRIDFTGGGACHFGVCWICHNILPEKLLFR